MGKAICLYFGSFNPLHIGHTALARYMVERRHFDEVWYVLSPRNPLKDRDSYLPYDIRRNLIISTVEREKDRCSLCEIEKLLPEPHYTIRTIQALRLLYPLVEFSLLIGQDNLQHLEKWYDSDRLLKSIDIYVYPRTEDGIYMDNPRLAQYTSIHYCSDAPLIDVSSTQIRDKMRLGQDYSHLLPYPDLTPLVNSHLDV